MKKIVLLFALLLLLSGCSSDSDTIVEVPERFFITQITDIHMNADENVGRTIRFEGMFQTIYWPATGEYYHWVYRYVFDCCGNDGEIGFEVYLGDSEPFADDAWVEVTGVLEWYEVGAHRLLRVSATSIREMDARGLEIVTQ